MCAWQVLRVLCFNMPSICVCVFVTCLSTIAMIFLMCLSISVIRVMYACVHDSLSDLCYCVFPEVALCFL